MSTDPKLPGEQLKHVLHLYSNHKWTGPADHALNLAYWLKSGGQVDTWFACARRGGRHDRLYQKASELGLSRIDGMILNKHLGWKIIPDIFALKKIVARRRIDVIHSHQDNDTLTAVLAGFGNQVIRTCYEGEPAPLSFRQRFFFQRTAKILTASSRVQSYLGEIFPDKSIEQVDIPVDGNRFRPMQQNEKLRAEFGLTAGDPVAGIVARVQKHRNFELLLKALKQVVSEIPHFKFLIVGRGTHIDAVARRPVKELGIDKNVIFTGYRTQDYSEVLNLFDFKIFLTPGSDGSCRAVREALACGKPVIASRKGILPELIKDGETGILVENRPADLARGIRTMAGDHEFRLRCSAAARRYALDVLDPERYVRKVTDCYEALGSQKQTKNHISC